VVQNLNGVSYEQDSRLVVGAADIHDDNEDLPGVYFGCCLRPVSRRVYSSATLGWPRLALVVGGQPYGLSPLSALWHLALCGSGDVGL
jgi:hypothetical protein